MQEATETTDLSAIRLAWEKVFDHNDPFAWPFQRAFKLGRVFYPTEGYHLTRPQFLALKEALEIIGEVGFFISVVESDGLEFLDRKWGHWICDDLAYEEYIKLPLALENALYSRDGRWGLLISQEMHALIAGTPEFLVALTKQYRGWSDDLRLLHEAWSKNPNSGWLDQALRHTDVA